MHTTAAILSTGDELVLGQLLDTNARWIAEQLTTLGIRVVQVAVVGDDLNDLTAAIARLASTHDLLITTGGLGPTAGDLTREALAQASSDHLIVDQEQVNILSTKLRNRGRNVNDQQLRQALRPTRATPLPNAHGTAPGLCLRIRNCDTFSLPGPPGELQPMWLASVIPTLHPDRKVLTRLLYALGIPEATCAERLKDLTARARTPLIGMTASGGIITIRMRYEGADAAEGQALLDRDEADICTRLGTNICATATAGQTHSDQALASVVLNQLTQRGEMLALAESCTGGMVAEVLTRTPGSSAALAGGVVCYTNAVKTTLLGVSAETLANNGAVSEPVASAMALGARRVIPADWSIAITGIAGPDGATATKPLGTVWIALAGPNAYLQTRHFHFPGTRHDVRTRSTLSALAMLHFALKGAPLPRLLWQQEDAGAG
jgi:nicotinamide-nucleotide amidase